jgi:hypothetical protein
MPWSTSLVVDEPSGEQIVRLPRRTDTIGASLREAFGTGTGLPDDMISLLGKLDRAHPQ